MADRRDPIITDVNVDVIVDRKDLLGLTYYVFADRIGSTYHRVYDLCNGHNNNRWRSDELAKTLEVLQLTPEDVINNPVILEGYYIARQERQQGDNNNGND